MIADERVDRDRLAETDDGVSVSLEASKHSAPEILEEKIERRAELFHARRSILPPHQLLGQISILEDAVVIDGRRNDEQRLGEFGTALGLHDVVEHAELRLQEGAVARQTAF